MGDGLDNCLEVTNPGLDFDGENDFIQIDGSESNFDFTSSMTVEAWIKVAAFDKTWQTIVAKGDNSWRLHRNNQTNRIAFSLNGIGGFSGANTITSSTDLNDGKWHHIAGVHTGTNQYLYVDGVLSASASESGAINNSNFPVTIGENAQATGRHFEGTIDEVRIWSIARSENDIQAYLNKELNSTEAGLVAYYDFNEGIPEGGNASQSTVKDISGNSNTGTLMNFAKTGNRSNWVIGAPIIHRDLDENGIGDVCEGGNSYNCTENDLTLGDKNLTETKYSARMTLTSESTIEAGNDVTFTAGNTISLTAGFHAISNATFTARIEDCAASDLPARIVPIITALPLENSAMELSLRPNPTRFSTTIEFNLAESSTAFLEVYNSRGQLVRQVLDNAPLDKGVYSETLITDNYEKGIYFITLRTAKEVLTKKLIILE